jgi:hypothetical protein
MKLIKGQKYSKSGLGISGPVFQWSEITVEGELYTFFSIDSKYDNIIEKDGFVYEGRGKYALVPKDVKANLHRHVFFRKTPKDDYTYLGRGKCETRYDEKHNKIFWEDE